MEDKEAQSPKEPLEEARGAVIERSLMLAKVCAEEGDPTAERNNLGLAEYLKGENDKHAAAVFVLGEQREAARAVARKYRSESLSDGVIEEEEKYAEQAGLLIGQIREKHTGPKMSAEELVAYVNGRVLVRSVF